MTPVKKFTYLMFEVMDLTKITIKVNLFSLARIIIRRLKKKFNRRKDDVFQKES